MGKKSLQLTAEQIDEIFDALADTATLRQLAAQYGAKRSTLHEYLTATPELLARYKSARMRSSEAYEDAADHVISDARDPFELARARELAHHYRWAARVRSPGTHGDRSELVGNTELTPDFAEVLRQIASKLPV